MKKKVIYVAIAMVVVAILVVCFQIIPKTLVFDFESNPMVSVMITYDENPTDLYNRTRQHLNQAQIDELQSQLTSLSGVKKVKESSEELTIASISIALDNSKSLNFQSKTDGKLQLICHPGTEVYRINDEEFHRYLIDFCSTALLTGETLQGANIYHFTAEVAKYGNDARCVKVTDVGDSTLSIGEELYVSAANGYDDYPIGCTVEVAYRGAIIFYDDGNCGPDRTISVCRVQ